MEDKNKLYQREPAIHASRILNNSKINARDNRSNSNNPQ